MRLWRKITNYTMKECPLCNGLGKIEKSLPIDVKRKKAKLMHEMNFSIREIMRALNYKSPRSVQDLLTN